MTIDEVRKAVRNAIQRIKDKKLSEEVRKHLVEPVKVNRASKFLKSDGTDRCWKILDHPESSSEVAFRDTARKRWGFLVFSKTQRGHNVDVCWESTLEEAFMECRAWGTDAGTEAWYRWERKKPESEKDKKLAAERRKAPRRKKKPRVIESAPADLHRLLEIDSQTKCGVSFLGIDIDMSQARYSNTPADLLPFAWTGGDGYHFGFLTDFGLVTDLSKAWIVCVRPAEDMHIVARNLRGFLALMCKVKHGDDLANLDLAWPEKEWLESNEETWEFCDRDQADRIAALLKKELKLSSPRSIYDYVRKVRAERAKAIACTTLDGLGVIFDMKPKGKVRKYKFDGPARTNARKMKSFLKDTSDLEKLAFCRDAQAACGHHEKVQKLVVDVLEEMGLTEESARVASED